MGEATRSRRRQGQSMRQALTTASQIREATINKKFRYQRGGTHYRYELAIALKAFEQKFRAEQLMSPSFDRKREKQTWLCPPGCDSIDLRPCLDSVAPVHFVTRERSRGVILAHVAGSHHNLLFKFVSEGRWRNRRSQLDSRMPRLYCPRNECGKGRSRGDWSPPSWRCRCPRAHSCSSRRRRSCHSRAPSSCIMRFEIFRVEVSELPPETPSWTRNV